MTVQRRFRMTAIAAILIALAAAPARADFTEIVNDPAGWESALSDQESIFFNEFPGGTFLTDQYADLGILFTNGNDFITPLSSSKDGFGLSAFLGSIRVAFDRPRTAIAADVPAAVQFRLFYDGEMIYNSTGYGGDNLFVGILADQPFDEAWIRNPGGGIEIIDNLFFGDVIPAPGALGVFGLAALATRQRRRVA